MHSCSVEYLRAYSYAMLTFGIVLPINSTTTASFGAGPVIRVHAFQPAKIKEAITMAGIIVQTTSIVLLWAKK